MTIKYTLKNSKAAGKRLGLVLSAKLNTPRTFHEFITLWVRHSGPAYVLYDLLEDKDLYELQDAFEEAAWKEFKKRKGIK